MKTNVGGRPSIEITGTDLSIIERMAGLGSTLDEIATVLGWSPATLDRKLKDESAQAAYSRGRAVAKHTMAGRLWDIAMSDEHKGSTTACIFWLKSQAGWSDRLTIEQAPAASESQVQIYIPDNGR